MINLKINANANDLKIWKIPFLSKFDYGKIENLLMFDKQLTILVNDNEASNNIITYSDLNKYLFDVFINDSEFRKILKDKGIIVDLLSKSDIVKMNNDINFEVKCYDAVDAYRMLNSDRGTYLASVAREAKQFLLMLINDN